MSKGIRGRAKKMWTVCPKCKNEELTVGDILIEPDDLVYRNITCACGFSWKEVFAFEMNYGSNWEALFDNGDEIV